MNHNTALSALQSVEETSLQDLSSAVSHFRDVVELFHTADYVTLVKITPGLCNILSSVVAVSFNPKSEEHKLRSKVLELLIRLPPNESLRSYLTEICISLINVIENDNEENAQLALKCLNPHLRSHPTVDMCNSLLDFVFKALETMPTSVSELLNDGYSSIQTMSVLSNHPFTTATSYSQAVLKAASEGSITRRPESEQPQEYRGALSGQSLLPSYASFRVIIELVSPLISALELRKEVLTEAKRARLVKALVTFFSLNSVHDLESISKGNIPSTASFVPPGTPSDSPSRLRATRISELATAQAKAITLLNRLCKMESTSGAPVSSQTATEIGKYDTAIASSIIMLLARLSPDALAARMDVFNNTFQLLNTPLRAGIEKCIDGLLDRRVLLGGPSASSDSLRNSAFLFVCDVSCVLLPKLGVRQLAALAGFLLPVALDATMPMQVCYTVIRLINESVLHLRANADRNPSEVPATRSLIVAYLGVFQEKLHSLRVVVPRFLAAEARQREDAARDRVAKQNNALRIAAAAELVATEKQRIAKVQESASGVSSKEEKGSVNTPSSVGVRQEARHHAATLSVGLSLGDASPSLLDEANELLGPIRTQEGVRELLTMIVTCLRLCLYTLVELRRGPSVTEQTESSARSPDAVEPQAPTPGTSGSLRTAEYAPGAAGLGPHAHGSILSNSELQLLRGVSLSLLDCLEVFTQSPSVAKKETFNIFELFSAFFNVLVQHDRNHLRELLAFVVPAIFERCSSQAPFMQLIQFMLSQATGPCMFEELIHIVVRHVHILADEPDSPDLWREFSFSGSVPGSIAILSDAAGEPSQSDFSSSTGLLPPADSIEDCNNYGSYTSVHQRLLRNQARSRMLAAGNWKFNEDGEFDAVLLPFLQNYDANSSCASTLSSGGSNIPKGVLCANRLARRDDDLKTEIQGYYSSTIFRQTQSASSSSGVGSTGLVGSGPANSSLSAPAGSSSAHRSLAFFKIVKMLLAHNASSSSSTDKFEALMSLKPYIGPLIRGILRNLNASRSPTILLYLLRQLIRHVSQSMNMNINSSAMTKLHAEFAAVTPQLLDSMMALYAISGPSDRDIILDICLYIPLRLNMQVVHLHRLLRPVALALRAREDRPQSVKGALKTLEFWLDNLSPGFFTHVFSEDPALHADLLGGLTGLLKPSAIGPHGDDVLRLLGAMGGLNRTHMTAVPHIPHVSSVFTGSGGGNEALRVSVEFRTPKGIYLPPTELSEHNQLVLERIFFNDPELSKQDSHLSSVSSASVGDEKLNDAHYESALNLASRAIASLRKERGLPDLPESDFTAPVGGARDDLVELEPLSAHLPIDRVLRAAAAVLQRFLDPVREDSSIAGVLPSSLANSESQNVLPTELCELRAARAGSGRLVRKRDQPSTYVGSRLTSEGKTAQRRRVRLGHTGEPASLASNGALIPLQIDVVATAVANTPSLNPVSPSKGPVNVYKDNYASDEESACEDDYYSPSVVVLRPVDALRGALRGPLVAKRRAWALVHSAVSLIFRSLGKTTVCTDHIYGSDVSVIQQKPASPLEEPPFTADPSTPPLNPATSAENMASIRLAQVELLRTLALAAADIHLRSLAYPVLLSVIRELVISLTVDASPASLDIAQSIRLSVDSHIFVTESSKSQMTETIHKLAASVSNWPLEPLPASLDPMRASQGVPSKESSVFDSSVLSLFLTSLVADVPTPSATTPSSADISRSVFMTIIDELFATFSMMAKSPDVSVSAVEESARLRDATLLLGRSFLDDLVIRLASASTRSAPRTKVSTLNALGTILSRSHPSAYVRYGPLLVRTALIALRSHAPQQGPAVISAALALLRDVVPYSLPSQQDWNAMKPLSAVSNAIDDSVYSSSAQGDRSNCRARVLALVGVVVPHLVGPVATAREAAVSILAQVVRACVDPSALKGTEGNKTLARGILTLLSPFCDENTVGQAYSQATGWPVKRASRERQTLPQQLFSVISPTGLHQQAPRPAEQLAAAVTVASLLNLIAEARGVDHNTDEPIPLPSTLNGSDSSASEWEQVVRAFSGKDLFTFIHGIIGLSHHFDPAAMLFNPMYIAAMAHTSASRKEAQLVGPLSQAFGISAPPITVFGVHSMLTATSPPLHPHRSSFSRSNPTMEAVWSPQELHAVISAAQPLPYPFCWPPQRAHSAAAAASDLIATETVDRLDPLQADQVSDGRFYAHHFELPVHWNRGSFYSVPPEDANMEKLDFEHRMSNGGPTFRGRLFDAMAEFRPLNFPVLLRLAALRLIEAFLISVVRADGIEVDSARVEREINDAKTQPGGDSVELEDEHRRLLDESKRVTIAKYPGARSEEDVRALLDAAFTLTFHTIPLIPDPQRTRGNFFISRLESGHLGALYDTTMPISQLHTGHFTPLLAATYSTLLAFPSILQKQSARHAALRSLIERFDCDFKELKIPNADALCSVLPALKPFLNAAFAAKILGDLSQWKSIRGIRERLDNSGRETEVAAALLNLIHLLPMDERQRVNSFVEAAVMLEAKLHLFRIRGRLNSPYTAPVARFLSAHPVSSARFFLGSCRFLNPQYAALLLTAVELPASSEFQRYIISTEGQQLLIRACFYSEADMQSKNDDLSAVVVDPSLEDELQSLRRSRTTRLLAQAFGLRLLAEIVKQNPRRFASPELKPLHEALARIWDSRETLLRLHSPLTPTVPIALTAVQAPVALENDIPPENDPSCSVLDPYSPLTPPWALPRSLWSAPMADLRSLLEIQVVLVRAYLDHIRRSASRRSASLSLSSSGEFTFVSSNEPGGEHMESTSGEDEEDSTFITLDTVVALIVRICGSLASGVRLSTADVRAFLETEVATAPSHKLRSALLFTFLETPSVSTVAKEIGPGAQLSDEIRAAAIRSLIVPLIRHTAAVENEVLAILNTHGIEDGARAYIAAGGSLSGFTIPSDYVPRTPLVNVDDVLSGQSLLQTPFTGNATGSLSAAPTPSSRSDMSHSQTPSTNPSKGKKNNSLSSSVVSTPSLSRSALSAGLGSPFTPFSQRWSPTGRPFTFRSPAWPSSTLKSNSKSSSLSQDSSSSQNPNVSTLSWHDATAVFSPPYKGLPPTYSAPPASMAKAVFGLQFPFMRLFSTEWTASLIAIITAAYSSTRSESTPWLCKSHSSPYVSVPQPVSENTGHTPTSSLLVELLRLADVSLQNLAVELSSSAKNLFLPLWGLRLSSNFVVKHRAYIALCRFEQVIGTPDFEMSQQILLDLLDIPRLHFDSIMTDLWKRAMNLLLPSLPLRYNEREWRRTVKTIKKRICDEQHNLTVVPLLWAAIYDHMRIFYPFRSILIENVVSISHKLATLQTLPNLYKELLVQLLQIVATWQAQSRLDDLLNNFSMPASGSDVVEVEFSNSSSDSKSSTTTQSTPFGTKISSMYPTRLTSWGQFDVVGPSQGNHESAILTEWIVGFAARAAIACADIAVESNPLKRRSLDLFASMLRLWPDVSLSTTYLLRLSGNRLKPELSHAYSSTLFEILTAVSCSEGRARDFISENIGFIMESATFAILHADTSVMARLRRFLKRVLILYPEPTPTDHMQYARFYGWLVSFLCIRFAALLDFDSAHAFEYARSISENYNSQHSAHRAITKEDARLLQKIADGTIVIPSVITGNEKDDVAAALKSWPDITEAIAKRIVLTHQNDSALVKSTWESAKRLQTGIPSTSIHHDRHMLDLVRLIRECGRLSNSFLNNLSMFQQQQLRNLADFHLECEEVLAKQQANEPLSGLSFLSGPLEGPTVTDPHLREENRTIRATTLATLLPLLCLRQHFVGYYKQPFVSIVSQLMVNSSDPGVLHTCLRMIRSWLLAPPRHRASISYGLSQKEKVKLLESVLIFLAIPPLGRSHLHNSVLLRIQKLSPELFASLQTEYYMILLELVTGSRTIGEDMSGAIQFYRKMYFSKRMRTEDVEDDEFKSSFWDSSPGDSIREENILKPSMFWIKFLSKQITLGSVSADSRIRTRCLNLSIAELRVQRAFQMREERARALSAQETVRAQMRDRASRRLIDAKSSEPLNSFDVPDPFSPDYLWPMEQFVSSQNNPIPSFSLTISEYAESFQGGLNQQTAAVLVHAYADVCGLGPVDMRPRLVGYSGFSAQSCLQTESEEVRFIREIDDDIVVEDDVLTTLQDILESDWDSIVAYSIIPTFSKLLVRALTPSWELKSGEGDDLMDVDPDVSSSPLLSLQRRSLISVGIRPVNSRKDIRQTLHALEALLPLSFDAACEVFGTFFPLAWQSLSSELRNRLTPQLSALLSKDMHSRQLQSLSPLVQLESLLGLQLVSRDVGSETAPLGATGRYGASGASLLSAVTLEQIVGSSALGLGPVMGSSLHALSGTAARLAGSSFASSVSPAFAPTPAAFGSPSTCNLPIFVSAVFAIPSEVAPVLPPQVLSALARGVLGVGLQDFAIPAMESQLESLVHRSKSLLTLLQLLQQQFKDLSKGSVDNASAAKVGTSILQDRAASSLEPGDVVITQAASNPNSLPTSPNSVSFVRNVDVVSGGLPAALRDDLTFAVALVPTLLPLANGLAGLDDPTLDDILQSSMFSTSKEPSLSLSYHSGRSSWTKFAGHRLTQQLSVRSRTMLLAHIVRRCAADAAHQLSEIQALLKEAYLFLGEVDLQRGVRRRFARTVDSARAIDLESAWSIVDATEMYRRALSELRSSFPPSDRALERTFQTAMRLAAGDSVKSELEADFSLGSLTNAANSTDSDNKKRSDVFSTAVNAIVSGDSEHMVKSTELSIDNRQLRSAPAPTSVGKRDPRKRVARPQLSSLFPDSSIDSSASSTHHQESEDMRLSLLQNVLSTETVPWNDIIMGTANTQLLFADNVTSGIFLQSSSTGSQNLGYHLGSQELEPPSVSEVGQWENGWVEGLKAQSQWQAVKEYASLIDDEGLKVEAAAKLGDWKVILQASAGLLSSTSTSTSTPPISFSRRLLMLQALIMMGGRDEDVAVAVQEAYKQWLIEWASLPGRRTPAHERLLGQAQRLADTRDAIAVSVGVRKASSSSRKPVDVRSVLSAWRGRLPNRWDGLQLWDDVLGFRLRVFEQLQHQTAPDQPDTLGNDATWTMIKQAHIARKLGLSNVAGRVLDLVENVKTLDVHEHFSATRETLMVHIPERSVAATAQLMQLRRIMRREDELVLFAYSTSSSTAPADESVRGRKYSDEVLNLAALGFKEAARPEPDLYTDEYRASIFLARARLFETLGEKHWPDAYASFASSLSNAPTFGKGWLAWGQFLDRLSQQLNVEYSNRSLREEDESAIAQEAMLRGSMPITTAISSMNSGIDDLGVSSRNPVFLTADFVAQFARDRGSLSTGSEPPLSASALSLAVDKRLAGNESEVKAEDGTSSKPPVTKTAIVAAQAIYAYLAAASNRCTTPALQIARVFRLLQMEDGSGVVIKALEGAFNIPVWLWIPWLPQLLTSLNRPESEYSRLILRTVIHTYPQAAHMIIREHYQDTVEVLALHKATPNSEYPFPRQMALAEEAFHMIKQYSPVASITEAFIEDVAQRTYKPTIEEDICYWMSFFTQSALLYLPTKDKDTDFIATLLKYLLSRIFPDLKSVSGTGKEVSDKEKESNERRSNFKWRRALLLDFSPTLTSEIFDGASPEIIQKIFDALPSASVAKDVSMEKSAKRMKLEDSSSVSVPNFNDLLDQPNPFIPTSLQQILLRLRKWRERLLLELVRRPARALDTCSPVLVDAPPFTLSAFGTEMEVPGQYISCVDSEPNVSAHTRVLAVEVSMQPVMFVGATARRLVLLGSDGRVHPFLARSVPQNNSGSAADSRMVQATVFANVHFSRHAASRARGLRLPVVPSMLFLGRIRCTQEPSGLYSLYDILDNQLSTISGTNSNLRGENPSVETTEDPLLLNSADALAVFFKRRLDERRLISAEEATEWAFSDVCRKVPRSLLSQALLRYSASPEAYGALRAQLRTQISTQGFWSQILSISDRSPSKLAISMGTGQFVSLESRPSYVPSEAFATTSTSGSKKSLKDPAMRLTPNVVNIMSPQGITGTYAASLIVGAQALQRQFDWSYAYFFIFFRDDLTAFLNTPRSSKPSQSQPAAAQFSAQDYERLSKSGVGSMALAAGLPGDIPLVQKRVNAATMDVLMSLAELMQGSQGPKLDANNTHPTWSPHPNPTDLLRTTVYNQIYRCMSDRFLARQNANWHPWF